MKLWKTKLWQKLLYNKQLSYYPASNYPIFTVLTISSYRDCFLFLPQCHHFLAYLLRRWVVERLHEVLLLDASLWENAQFNFLYQIERPLQWLHCHYQVNRVSLLSHQIQFNNKQEGNGHIDLRRQGQWRYFFKYNINLKFEHNSQDFPRRQFNTRPPLPPTVILWSIDLRGFAAGKKIKMKERVILNRVPVVAPRSQVCPRSRPRPRSGAAVPTRRSSSAPPWRRRAPSPGRPRCRSSCACSRSHETKTARLWRSFKWLGCRNDSKPSKNTSKI